MTSRSLITTCLAGTLLLLPACAASREREAALQDELHAMRDHVRAMEQETEHLRARLHEMSYEREAMHQADRELPREVHELMRAAVEILVETDRHDLAEQMEMALHAMQLEHEGRDDPEAMHVRERAPSAGNTAEILMHSAAQWDKAGWETRAERMRGLAREWMQRAEHERQREDRGRGGRDDVFETLPRRVDELEERLEKMGQRLKRVVERMEELAAEG